MSEENKDTKKNDNNNDDNIILYNANSKDFSELSSNSKKWRFRFYLLNTT